ncbi:MAG TPA: AbrB/MazE/SpoVT family DNA-binding domain-containing protein [Candidatus Paceibacterota bacterium]|nr:AbrB/MazE/SpoVT family DNA-binding domain-containing protein [Candidatus Paceibacterota bacterium]
MAPSHKKEESLVGVTTVGEKGQIVIPADIRATFQLGKGAKLMVIAHDKGIFLMRPAALEHMANRFNALQSLIKKSK